MSETEYAEHIGELVRLTHLFVRRKLEVWPEFKAALIVGSVAHNEARIVSDVDCIFVFDRVDERILPAEFVWIPTTDTYHTIFEVEATEAGGVQIDAKRLSIEELRDDEWEEGFKSDLASAITIADRDETVVPLLKKRLRYPDGLRRSRVAEHYGRARYYVEEWRLQQWINRGGLACAHDQLTAAFEEIVKLLHAYNSVWLPWRYRRLISARKLPWLPDSFAMSVETIVNRVSPSEENLQERRKELVRMIGAIEDELRSAALLANPDEAFLAAHPELGYAHNMDAWRQGHRQLLNKSRG